MSTDDHSTGAQQIKAQQIKELPANPSLDNLRRQARALQRDVHAAGPDALDRVARQYAGGVKGRPGEFPLSTAQLVVAREYGFASWPKLKQYVEVVAEYGWQVFAHGESGGSGSGAPGEHAGSGPGARSALAAGGSGAAGGDGGAGAADEFCRLACLRYSDEDGPERWAEARRMLEEDPGLPGDHIWAAAAAADPETVGRLLERDRGLGRKRGGPYRWEALSYLAYSRLRPDVSAAAVLRTARLLLGAGADPNGGSLWNGGPYAFTVLAGVFGEGEQGPVKQPRHPHWVALARLLLDAGADPNDSQSLYNRMFEPDNAHLELLFEYGLGTGNGGPWKARLGDALPSPSQLLQYQLKWAVEHNFADRVRLLVDHGADPGAASGEGEWRWDSAARGRTPVELAYLCGNAEIVDLLVARGAVAPQTDPVGDLVAAAFRADRAEVDRLRTAYPEVVDEARRSRPGLIVWAASQGRADTVSLLVELGFDVNALGRGDAPMPGAWETALHRAALDGDVELAWLLVSLGADPGARDARFDATPLGWARHGDQDATAELLAPLTPG